MKLGIGLPNTLVPDLNRKLLLDWARASDQAGFHVLGTIDNVTYDSWDPLATLAAAAAVTERVRLATTILQLPIRNETVVAKQAAVIDRLSGGRLDLGLAVGGREADYKALSARLKGRGKRFERQVRKIRRLWRAARKVTPEEGALGPAPIQKPGPPIWIGGMSPPAVARAARLGDGFIFGTAGSEIMARETPRIRAMAEEAGRKKFAMVGLAYCAIGEDARRALDEGARFARRYYSQGLWKEPAQLIHHGPSEVIAQAAKEYEAAGLDILILFPLIPDLRQVERLAEDVLPAHR